MKVIVCSASFSNLISVMKFVSHFFFLFTFGILFTACNNSTNAIQDSESYIETIEKWQQERIESLKDSTGWLNLAGIYWLNDGVQNFGSDTANDIVFPAGAPAFIGSLTLKGEMVHLEVNDGIDVFYENEIVKDLNLSYSSSGNPSYISHGSFAWYIMKRHQSMAIRLRDYKNPAIEALDHIPSFPIDPDYVAEASLEAFDEPKIMTVSTPFEGYTQDYDCPGVLHFKLKGKKLKLHPFTSGDGYFIIIADETSGMESYGGGRFMYATPNSTGRILLDFNKAYNPPCAITEFAACPMPPPENYLPVKIEAGEKLIAIHK